MNLCARALAAVASNVWSSRGAAPLKIRLWHLPRKKMRCNLNARLHLRGIIICKTDEEELGEISL